jgi:hypothetical protein
VGGRQGQCVRLTSEQSDTWEQRGGVHASGVTIVTDHDSRVSSLERYGSMARKVATARHVRTVQK